MNGARSTQVNPTLQRGRSFAGDALTDVVKAPVTAVGRVFTITGVEDSDGPGFNLFHYTLFLTFLFSVAFWIGYQSVPEAPISETQTSVPSQEPTTSPSSAPSKAPTKQPTAAGR